MKRKYPQLTSLPYIMLYVTAAGAVMLSLLRERYGSESWYLMSVGLIAACGIFAVRKLLLGAATTEAMGKRGYAIFFFIAAFLLAGGAMYFIGEENSLALRLFVAAGILLLGGFGSVFEWPGFRSPPKPNQCRKCRYDLTGNVSGVCPECGTPLDAKAQDP